MLRGLQRFGWLIGTLSVMAFASGCSRTVPVEAFDQPVSASLRTAQPVLVNRIAAPIAPQSLCQAEFERWRDRDLIRSWETRLHRQGRGPQPVLQPAPEAFQRIYPACSVVLR